MNDASGTSASKKRGRPKGSKNKDREPIAIIPPNCPHCGKSGFKDKKEKKVWPRLGSPKPPYNANGRRFERIRWSHAWCAACGRHYHIVEHLDEIIQK